MTGGIITYAAGGLPSHDLPPGLFDRFIDYIDRPGTTTKTYICNLRQFAAYMAYNAIRRPQRADIIAYRDYLGQEHDAIIYDDLSGWRYRKDRTGRRYRITCRPNTVSQYLRSVKQFFSWTASEGLYPDIATGIHGPKVRQDHHRKEALTATDVLIIENNIKARAATMTSEQNRRLLAMYLLAVTAGLRTVELSRANVGDLEIKAGQATLYIWGKGHSEPDQKKPLAPAVYEVIRNYLAIRADIPTNNSPLFVSTGNRSGGKRIASTTISRMLKRALQAAGYDSERITAHSLRHTCGTATQEITGNLYITQKYMRHTNPRTTEIYLHNNTEKQEAQTARALYDYYHSTAANMA